VSGWPSDRLLTGSELVSPGDPGSPDRAIRSLSVLSGA